jgi:hypothetical protein
MVCLHVFRWEILFVMLLKYLSIQIQVVSAVPLGISYNYRSESLAMRCCLLCYFISNELLMPS